jgi:hypothetical protein
MTAPPNRSTIDPATIHSAHHRGKLAETAL